MNAFICLFYRAFSRQFWSTVEKVRPQECLQFWFSSTFCFNLECLNLENLLISYFSLLTWNREANTKCFFQGSLQGALSVIPNPRSSCLIFLRLREPLGNGNIPSFLGLQFSWDYMEISFRSIYGRAVLWQSKTLNQNKTEARQPQNGTWLNLLFETNANYWKLSYMLAWWSYTIGTLLASSNY